MDMDNANGNDMLECNECADPMKYDELPLA